ncbi:MAG TPA: hypothetical protein PLQ56_06830 [Aggregatilineales bacterium]|nr:hypothetical protein [Aggregatilineales bacterium]
MIALWQIAFLVTMNPVLFVLIFRGHVIADRFRSVGQGILEKGVIEKGSGFFGMPYKDVPADRSLGQVYIQGSYFWRIARWVFPLPVLVADLYILRLWLG